MRFIEPIRKHNGLPLQTTTDQLPSLYII